MAYGRLLPPRTPLAVRLCTYLTDPRGGRDEALMIRTKLLVLEAQHVTQLMGQNRRRGAADGGGEESAGTRDTVVTGAGPCFMGGPEYR
jgi:hypothetical protein